MGGKVRAIFHHHMLWPSLRGTFGKLERNTKAGISCALCQDGAVTALKAGISRQAKVLRPERDEGMPQIGHTAAQ